MKCKEKLSSIERAHEAGIEFQKSILNELQQRINSKNKLLDHYEQILKSCESENIYLKSRLTKAYEVIGEMTAEGLIE